MQAFMLVIQRSISSRQVYRLPRTAYLALVRTIRTWHAGVHAALHRQPGTSQDQPTGTGERGVGGVWEEVGIRWARQVHLVIHSLWREFNHQTK